MIMKRAELSECELITMKCIWDAKEPVTCQEVMATLRSKYDLDYKDTTVYTFLKNLRMKGFVDCYRKGVTHYVPIRDEIEYRDEQLRKTENFWFQGSSPRLVAALFQMKKMSKEEKENLKRMINELD